MKHGRKLSPSEIHNLFNKYFQIDSFNIFQDTEKRAKATHLLFQNELNSKVKSEERMFAYPSHSPYTNNMLHKSRCSIFLNDNYDVCLDEEYHPNEACCKVKIRGHLFNLKEVFTFELQPIAYASLQFESGVKCVNNNEAIVLQVHPNAQSLMKGSLIGKATKTSKRAPEATSFQTLADFSIPNPSSKPSAEVSSEMSHPTKCISENEAIATLCDKLECALKRQMCQGLILMQLSDKGGCIPLLMRSMIVNNMDEKYFKQIHGFGDVMSLINFKHGRKLSPSEIHNLFNKYFQIDSFNIFQDTEKRAKATHLLFQNELNSKVKSEERMFAYPSHSPYTNNMLHKSRCSIFLNDNYDVCLDEEYHPNVYQIFSHVFAPKIQKMLFECNFPLNSRGTPGQFFFAKGLLLF